MTEDSTAAIQRVELNERAEKNDIWKEATRHAAGLSLSENRPAHPDRELWYVPTATIWDAHRAEKLFEEFGITAVYDLGAGDCRVSLWLDHRGYDVTAYELNSEIVAAVRENMNLGGVDLRERDYFEDYDDMDEHDAAVVAFGGTNPLPGPPRCALGIEGYGETGVKVKQGAEVIAGW